MPDDVIAPPPPQLPPSENSEQKDLLSVQPENTDEHISEASPVVKNSIGAKLGKIGETISEKFGVPFKKGRGRPKKCRQCDGARCEKCNWTGVEPGKGDKPISSEVAPKIQPKNSPAPIAPVTGSDSAPVSPVKRFLLRRVVVSGVKGAKGITRFVLKGKAEEAGLDDGFIEKTFSRAEPSPKDWQDFDESTGLVLEKYNIKTEHDELLCWLADLGNLFKCDLLLYREFQTEIRRQRKEKEGKE